MPRRLTESSRRDAANQPTSTTYEDSKGGSVIPQSAVCSRASVGTRPGGAISACQAQPHRALRVGRRDLQGMPGHERLDGQGTRRALTTARPSSVPGAIARTGKLAWNQRHSPAWHSGVVDTIARRMPGPGRSRAGPTGSYRCRMSDGSLGLAPSLPSPCWATSHAILLGTP